MQYSYSLQEQLLIFFQFLDAGLKPSRELKQKDKDASKLRVAKDKSPARRFKSITEMATEKYSMPLNANDATDATTNLLHERVQSGTGTLRVSNSKSRKAEPSNPSVLSPQAASENCNNQNFLFGTSSQLAGPESPTYLRDQQRALDQSRRDAQQEWDVKLKTRARVQRGKLAVPSAPLWNAASCSSQTARQTSQITPYRNSESGEEVFKDIDDFSDSEPSPTVTATESANLESLTGNDENWGKPPHGEVPSVATAVISGNPRGPTKKVSTRQSDEFIPIDEIEDSESDRTPSPPRCPPASTEHLPLSSQAPSSKSPVRRRGSKQQWTEEERGAARATLFAAITKAIRQAPRGSISGPSWHERMLLFEPVVLEDLTDWLNGAGLRVQRKGGKEELEPWMVRQWCDEQSVCCVWKFNRKQQIRKGAAADAEPS
jgi:Slx4 endonuclease